MPSSKSKGPPAMPGKRKGPPPAPAKKDGGRKAVALTPEEQEKLAHFQTGNVGKTKDKKKAPPPKEKSKGPPKKPAAKGGKAPPNMPAKK